MKLKEASEFLKLPPSLLNYLHRKKIIHNPLTEDELDKLAFYRTFWRDTFILKCTMSKLSKDRRAKIVRERNLTKPEAYVLNRYLNAEKNPSLEQVIDELYEHFKIPFSTGRKIVQRIRQKAYRIKKKNPKPPKKEEHFDPEAGRRIFGLV